MAGLTRTNGASQGAVETLYSTAQLKAFLVTVKDASDTAIDLDADDATVEGSVEQIIRECSPLMYFIDSGSNGTIHMICDGHAVNAATLQARVRAVAAGIDGSAVADNDSTVIEGNDLTVAA